MVARNQWVASAVLMVLMCFCGCTAVKSVVNESRLTKAIKQIGNYDREPPMGYVPIYAEVVGYMSSVELDSKYLKAAEAVALREVAKLASNTKFIQTPPPFNVIELVQGKPLAEQANSDYVLGVTIDRLTLTSGAETIDLAKKEESTNEGPEKGKMKKAWNFVTSSGDSLETKITITLMQRDTHNNRWGTLVSGIGTAQYFGAVKLGYEDNDHQGSIVGKTASKLENIQIIEVAVDAAIRSLIKNFPERVIVAQIESNVGHNVVNVRAPNKIENKSPAP